MVRIFDHWIALVMESYQICYHSCQMLNVTQQSWSEIYNVIYTEKQSYDITILFVMFVQINTMICLYMKYVISRVEIYPSIQYKITIKLIFFCFWLSCHKEFQHVARNEEVNPPLQPPSPVLQKWVNCTEETMIHHSPYQIYPSLKLNIAMTHPLYWLTDHFM